MHPYTKSLLSAVPQPDPESERVRKRTVYTEDSANNSRRTLHEITPSRLGVISCNVLRLLLAESSV